MKIKELLERIRMGGKELSKGPKNDYTVGFEFEIVTEDLSNDEEDEYERFSDNWEGEGEDEFWRREFHRDIKAIQNLIKDYNMSPEYGYVPQNVIDRDDMEKRKDEYAKGDIVHQMPENTIEEKRAKLIQAAIIRHPSQSNENILGIVDGLEDDKVDGYLETYMGYIPKTPDLEDSDELSEDYIYTDESQQNYVELDEIDDPETFFELFTTTDLDKDRAYDSFREMYWESDRESMDQAFQERNYYSRNESKSAVSYIADALEDIVDESVVQVDSYHGASKINARWYVEPDGSITPSGAEIVSPVYSYQDGMKKFKDVLEMIRDDSEMSTNESTGVHVNIGDFSDISQIDLLKFLLIINENYVLKIFGRSNNTYTEPYIRRLIQILKSRDGEPYNQIIKDLNQYIINNGQKYRFINFSKLESNGFFELRALGGKNYEYKEAEMIQSINRVFRALEIASDPNDSKDTYLKKLYKFVSGDADEEPRDEKLNPMEAKVNDLVKSLRRDFPNMSPLNQNILSGISSDSAEFVKAIVGAILLGAPSGFKITDLKLNQKIAIRNLYKEIHKKYGTQSPDYYKGETGKTDVHKFIRSIVGKK
jgi:hypothetical protein